MSRRTPSRERSTSRSRLAVARDVATAVAVVVGAGATLAFEASADSSPLELRPASSSAVDPIGATDPTTAGAVTPTRGSGAGAGTPDVGVPSDPAAMATARAAAADRAAAQLASEREAARVAEEEEAARRAAEREAVWDRLADCESGAWDRERRPIPGTATWDYGLRPSEDGFFQGGLQFHPVTWDEFRDRDMPDHAGRASRAQQIAIAERVLAAQGWEAWPVCSKKLGYR